MQVDSGWFWLVLIDADWFWFDTDWFWMVLLWQYLQYVQTLLSMRGPRICFNDQHSKMLWHQAAFEQAYKASKMCPLKLGRPLSITFTPSDLLTGVSFPKCHQCQCKSENTVCVWSLLAASLVTAAAGGSLSLLLLLDRPLKTLTLWRRAASGQRVIGASLAFQIKAFRHTAIKSFLHFDNPQYAQMMKLNSS